MTAPPPIRIRSSEWTPRQKQVLDLLVRGKTNREIAESLNISLDGAKWHVSEIITRLGVETREEAADYWRAQNGMPARFFSLVRGLVPGAAASKVLGIGLAAGVAAGLAIAVILAWPSNERDISTSQPSAGETPAPDPVNPSGGGGDTVLSDGSNYGYQPMLAYTAPDGSVRKVDATGAIGGTALSGCKGLGSAKQGDVVNGGLTWSADGSRIACGSDDLSVVAADFEGSATWTAFGPGECEFVLEAGFSPDGQGFLCGASSGTRISFADGSYLPIPAGSIGYAWSPNANAVIAEARDASASRIVWTVFAADGAELGTIDDAYVADPRKFAWSRDGALLAYPGDNGITIVDMTNGWSVSAVPAGDISLGMGPALSWVLDDTALLVHAFDGTTLIGRDGSELDLPDVPFGYARVAPDSKHVVTVTTAGGDEYAVAIVNLESGDVTPVTNSETTLRGEGTGPEFRWAGDSSRVCWAWQPSNQPRIFCTDLDAMLAFEVTAPVQVEPDTIGRGDMSVIWRGFSPDLQKVAYTTPGLPDPTAPQTLWMSDLDGSNAIDIGEALGVLPYEWQPDGVYRR